MADTPKKTKPIAGGIWGLLLGIGLALMAIDRKLIALSIAPAALFIVVGIVLGLLWALFGPAKKPKVAPPTA